VGGFGVDTGDGVGSIGVDTGDGVGLARELLLSHIEGAQWHSLGDSWDMCSVCMAFL